MNFRQIELEDRELALPCIEAAGSMSCDTSFVNMFIWKNIYKSEICFENGFLFRRGVGAERFKYRFPLGGGDIFAALSAIEKDAGEAGRLPEFVGLTEDHCGVIEKAYPGVRYMFEKKPDWADYIYRASDLAELTGKKYHAKRNFINRFQQQYEGRYTLAEIRRDEFPEILEFTRIWCEKNGCIHDMDLSRELCAVKTAFSYYEALGLVGLCLRLDGKVIAYTLASRLIKGVADVHFEKADSDIDGSYAVINNALARHLAKEYVYINREEDLGLPGLRKAKASYHPEIHLMRYNAIPQDGNG